MFRLQDDLLKILNRRRYVGQHLALFTLFVLLVSLFRLIIPVSAFQDVFFTSGLNILLVMWSGVLFTHATWATLSSGAWAGRREPVVRDSVMIYAEAQGLTASEAIQLHRELSTYIRKRSAVHRWLFFASTANTVVWFGGFLLVILGEIFLGEGVMRYGDHIVPISMLLTLLISVVFPPTFIARHTDEVETLFEDYYQKRLKRQPLFDDDFAVGSM
jgi:hypothetical protein